MNVLILKASPRKSQGASSRCADALGRGLERAGAQVESLYLKDYNINHCVGCYSCWTRTPGQCIHKDDMAALLHKESSADLIVMAIPLYISTVPGLLKDYMDRRLPRYMPYLNKVGDTTGHPVREGFGSDAKMFIISTAGFPERGHFQALDALFEQISAKRGETSSLAGKLYVPGSEIMAKNNGNEFTELYGLIEQAGEELGRDGVVSTATDQALIDMLSYTPEEVEVFRENSNHFWETFLSECSETQDIMIPEGQKALQIHEKGMNSFFAGMAALYNPRVRPGYSGILQFQLDTGNWFLELTPQGAKAYSGLYENPSMTLFCDEDLWMDISEGIVDGSQALMKGRYRMEGDMSLLLDMDALFSSEENSEDLSGSEDNGASLYNSAEKRKKIPKTRGPLKLSGGLWLTLAFLPWMAHWILGSTISPMTGYLTALSLSFVQIVYHLITNRPTSFEWGTLFYILSAALLTRLDIAFFVDSSGFFEYLFLAGLWLGSCIFPITATAEFMRFDYPRNVWREKSFTETNRILTGIWGLYYMMNSILALVDISFGLSSWLVAAIHYGSLIPMFIFTGWFVKWYVARLQGSVSAT